MSALAEDPALDGIDPGFDVFDLGPLVVTGHENCGKWDWDGESGGERRAFAPTAAERIGKKRTRGVTGSNGLLEASKARERAGGR